MAVSDATILLLLVKPQTSAARGKDGKPIDQGEGAVRLGEALVGVPV